MPKRMYMVMRDESVCCVDVDGILCFACTHARAKSWAPLVTSNRKFLVDAIKRTNKYERETSPVWAENFGKFTIIPVNVQENPNA